MNKETKRKRGEKIWDHSDPIAAVATPIVDWSKNSRQSTSHFRVELVCMVMYHVTDPFGGTWEVAVLADGTLEIVFPEEVDHVTKKKILTAIKKHDQEINEAD